MYNKMNCGTMKATRATISEIPILKSSGMCVSNIKNEWEYEEERVNIRRR